MRSPKNMHIIQIDITNACPHSCSNCTRFCGHHKKPFFMDFETFKQAVDSLKDFPRVVGMMGGEPTIHPQFEKFANYLRESRVGNIRYRLMREPVTDMLTYMRRHLLGTNSKLGLWCSLNEGYYKNFETINDTFPTQILNDHDNTCKHQALLMSRRELGIPDDVWIKKRDACWIQNRWSATITPKGGPGGWKVEPGWGRREVKDFGDQLLWCEICSGCLDVPQRISNDERDDMTPEIYEALKKAGSPKIKKGKFVVHDPKTFDGSKYHTFENCNDYMDAGDNLRTSSRNRNYYPKDFVYVTLDRLGKIPQYKQIKDWVLLTNDFGRAEKVFSVLKDCVINPGCLYIADKVAVFNVRAHSLRKFFNNAEELPENFLDYYPPDKIVALNI